MYNVHSHRHSQSNEWTENRVVLLFGKHFPQFYLHRDQHRHQHQHNSLYRVGIFTLGSQNKRRGVSYKSNQSMTRPGYPVKMKFMITSQDMKSMNDNVLGSADNPWVGNAGTNQAPPQPGHSIPRLPWIWWKMGRWAILLFVFYGWSKNLGIYSWSVEDGIKKTTIALSISDPSFWLIRRWKFPELLSILLEKYLGDTSLWSLLLKGDTQDTLLCALALKE